MDRTLYRLLPLIPPTYVLSDGPNDFGITYFSLSTAKEIEIVSFQLREERLGHLKLGATKPVVRTEAGCVSFCIPFCRA